MENIIAVVLFLLLSATLIEAYLFLREFVKGNAKAKRKLLRIVLTCFVFMTGLLMTVLSSS